MITSVVILSLAITVALAAGDWSGAKAKGDQYKQKRDDISKLAVAETRKVVAAACIADTETRSRADDVASDARSRINDKYRDLEHLQQEAVDMLDRVIADDSLKSNRDDARSLQSEIKSSWDKLKDKTREIRERARDIVDSQVKSTMAARKDRQDRCDAKEVSLGSGRAACLYARGDTCVAVEFAADDSSSISRARDRAARARRDLDSSDPDVIKHLIDTKREFAKCKHWETRVDCSQMCPDVSDDGQVRSRSASWREGC